MLSNFDSEIYKLISQDKEKNDKAINLIASENYCSKEVLEAVGSHLSYKYAEGFPNARYYNGCQYVDEIEIIANQRLQKLFNVKYTDVQAHAGSQANAAVFLGFLKPGDSYVSMSLDHGGHLTHGCKVNQSGKWFQPIHYTVSKDNHLIDMNQLEDIVKNNRPKLIIAGASAYPRKINFKAFREIANKYGCLLWADIAHISGLIAGGHHQSPVEYADIITSTTHKTLRGPRGAIFMSNNEDIWKKYKSSIFPGSQGGPFMNAIAARAVAFKEALDPSFRSYISQVISNASYLSNELKKSGLNIVSNGTDNHLLIVDISLEQFTGAQFADALESCGIIVNKNAIPYDHRPPKHTSGIRIGAPACTTRGMTNHEMSFISSSIVDVFFILRNDPNTDLSNPKFKDIKNNVSNLMSKFPINW